MDLSRPDYLPSPTERRRVPGRMPAATRHRHAAQTDTRHRQTRGTNRHAAQTDTWHKQTRGTNRHAAQTRGTDTRHKQTRGTDRHAAQTDTCHRQTRGTNRHVAQTDTRHKQTRGTDRHAAQTRGRKGLLVSFSVRPQDMFVVPSLSWQTVGARFVQRNGSRRRSSRSQTDSRD
jgi:hypothetical protein